MGGIEEFIENYHLVVDSSKSTDEILYIRSSIRSEKEVKSFMKKFEQKTCTIWRVHYGNYSPKRVVFRKAWVCRHSSIRSTDAEENNCEAKLDILVKKINPSTIKNDTFLLKEPPLPCIIRMRIKHNHSIEDDVKYLKIPDKVKELYYSYFDSGYGVAKALKLHELQIKRDKTFSVVNFVPSNRQVYYLYRQWQRRLDNLDIDENNIVDNDPWIVLNWDDLINAIPRENPPIKIKKMKVSDSQSFNFSDEENCESKDQVSLTNDIRKEKISNSTVATSSCVKNESSTPETIYPIDAPVTEQIAHSSNHMNGSVVTVMNSDCVASCSNFLSNSVASIIAPISSTLSFNMSSKPIGHFSENNLSETEQSSIDASSDYLKAIKLRSNYLHQSKVIDLSNSKISRSTSCNELKNKISQSCKKILHSKMVQVSPTIHNGINLTSLTHQISPTTTEKAQNSKMCNFLNPPASLSFRLIKPKDSIIDASSIDAFFMSHGKCSESSGSTQIHITNTVHQSGAQVSMKSSSPSIVNILHVSELLENSALPEEPIKIKDEPPDQDDSDFSPTIIKIASVDASEKVKPEPIIKIASADANEKVKPEPIIKIASADASESVKPEPIIKIEKTVGNIVENSSNEDSANTSQISAEEEDEDHGFIMSLLQELKQLSNPLKNKLKRKMQSLVSSALNTENGRKRRKL